MSCEVYHDPMDSRHLISHLSVPPPPDRPFSGPDRARLTSKGPLHPPYCISPRPLLFNPAPNKSPPAASRHMFSIL